jgi:hypothetical protein
VEPIPLREVASDGLEKLPMAIMNRALAPTTDVCVNDTFMRFLLTVKSYRKTFLRPFTFS